MQTIKAVDDLQVTLILLIYVQGKILKIIY